MSDAIGGTVNIVLIAVFMVLVSGYMAFNVSYVKAFKVKNRIIDKIEQYEGNCDPSNSSLQCTKEIVSYMKAIGYNSKIKINTSDWCSSTASFCSCNNSTGAGGYCINEVVTEKASTKKTKKGKIKTQTVTEKKAYYNVATQVTIDVPVINSLMPYLRVFRVTGETKTITVRR